MDKRLRVAILERDRACVAQRFMAHQCATTSGVPHSSGDLSRLTMEHVHDRDRRALGGRKSISAPDDLGHLVAVCGYANLVLVRKPGVEDQLREYLRHSARNAIVA